MVWALALALIWVPWSFTCKAMASSQVAFVSTTDGRLYTLGTEDPQSPRERCSVIHQGFEAQRTLMSTKAGQELLNQSRRAMMYIYIIFLDSSTGCIVITLRHPSCCAPTLLRLSFAFHSLSCSAGHSIVSGSVLHAETLPQGLNMHSTHADFVALVDGLPPINGTEELEQVLKTELQKTTAQAAWYFKYSISYIHIYIYIYA